jgi:acyl-CoA dehydrogenase
MEMSGFTEEQLTVRDAISKICANFPNEYWREHDQTETDPRELHAALAKDGWLGIALPEELGGAGLGMRRGGKSSQGLLSNYLNQAYPKQQ